MTDLPINPNYRNIVRTRAGRSDRLTSGDLYLDRNERAEPFPAEFMAGMAARLSKVALNQYPELDAIYERVASWLGVAADHVFLTEGVSGAVKAVLETLARPGGNVVFPDPGFALYPVYAEMLGQSVRRVPYRLDHTLDIAAVTTALDEHTSVVFLPSPNVPVGAYVTTQEIMALAAACADAGTALVVDEVYYPFGGESVLGLIDSTPNLLVARSFSKAFGAAGLRFGFIIGQPSLIQEVSKSRSGYELNALTAEAGLYFLDNEHVIREHIEGVMAGIAFAAKRLRDAGYQVNTEGSGNFMFVHLKDAEEANRVVAEMKDKGVHVRGGWSPPWDSGFSVTGAGAERMQKFTDVFLSVAGENGSSR